MSFFPYSVLTCAACLQTGLHMTACFRSNGATLLQTVFLGANDLEIDRPRISLFVQNPDVPQKINITPTIRLILRFAGPLLTPFAVANVDMLDAVDDLLQCFNGILISAMDVTRVHIETERGRADCFQRLQRGRRIVDGRANVRLHT